MHQQISITLEIGQQQQPPQQQQQQQQQMVHLHEKSTQDSGRASS